MKNEVQESRFEDKCRYIAKHFDTTQKELAAIMGMSPQNLNRLFKMNSIETKYLYKVANHFKIPVTYFFSESDSLDESENMATIAQKQARIDFLEKKMDMLAFIFNSDKI